MSQGKAVKSQTKKNIQMHNIIVCIERILSNNNVQTSEQYNKIIT